LAFGHLGANIGNEDGVDVHHIDTGVSERLPSGESPKLSVTLRESSDCSRALVSMDTRRGDQDIGPKY
jgi:hypothetical protein